MNTEEKSDTASIHAINWTNNISINDDDNYIHKSYAPFLSSKNREDVSSGSEYDSVKRRVPCKKTLFWAYY